MLRLAADENLNNDIVRGLLRRRPDLDIVRVQDVGLSGADDPTVLEWAARERRVLLTHDVSTITMHAYERIRAGQSMHAPRPIRQNPSRGSPLVCWHNCTFTVTVQAGEGEWQCSLQPEREL